MVENMQWTYFAKEAKISLQPVREREREKERQDGGQECMRFWKKYM